MDELISIDFKLLNRIFYNVLLKYYAEDGLYAEIASLTLQDLPEADDTSEKDLMFKDEAADVSYIAKIRYGRYISDRKNLNFDSELILTGYLSDDIEFTKGKFAQLIEDKEFIKPDTD